MSNTKIKAGQFSGIVGNGTDGYFLMTNGDGTMAWEEVATPSPTLTSVTYPGDDTAADPAGGQSVTLTGTNFATGATVTIGGTTAPTVSFVSATELTITTPAKAAGDYDIVVTNTDGKTATFVDGISYNGIPAWTTASGSLGTFASDTTISTITLQASEPDAGTITFNITSGALPTGLSLTGADIDGTTSKETADTLYNFTVTAIDDENQSSTPRAFSITVEKYILPAPENFEIVTYTGNGGTQAITSKIGKAASFNGSSSSIVTPLGYSQLPLSSPWTCSCWINSSSFSSSTNILGMEDGSAPYYGWSLYQNTSGVLYPMVNGNLQGSGTTLTANQWYNVILTYNGTVLKFYVNGFQIGSDLTVSISAPSSNFDIGNLGIYSVYNGKIDQVRIFNKALSQGEVDTLEAETYASSTKSTTDIFGDGSGVALYELDEDANDTGGISGKFGLGFLSSGESGDEYIDLPDALSRNQSQTLSAWIYPVTQSTDTGTAIRLAEDDNMNISYNTSGQFEISGVRDSSDTYANFTNVTKSANQWYHIAIARNASQIKLYIDGSLVETISWSGNLYSVGGQPYGNRIGQNNLASQSFTRKFAGRIDDVRVYSDELTLTEVGYIYNNTTASIPTGNLLAYYKLDGDATDEQGSYDGTEVNVSYAYNGTPTNVNFLGMAFQPDLVWIKGRSIVIDHAAFDTVRGAEKYISPSTTGAEGTYSTVLNAFGSNGFTVGSNAGVNSSSSTYVAWCWKAGGAAVLNEQGSIDSQVSANPDAGFSIVKYDGATNATTDTSNNGGSYWNVGHGLSSPPEMVIVKKTNNVGGWYVGALDGWTVGRHLVLNRTDAQVDRSGATEDVLWGNQNPTSTTFGLGGWDVVNRNGDSYIAYCFHSVDGYQKVGSYTGNGGTQSITLGFSPRFVMWKATNNVENWYMMDSVRGVNIVLYADGSFSEGGSAGVSFTPTGFTLTGSFNASNITYIYLAIA